MSEGFGAAIPGGDKPREESLGEAQYRWGSWLILLLRCTGAKYPTGAGYEEAAAKLVGPQLKRFPKLAKWKAPKK